LPEYQAKTAFEAGNRAEPISREAASSTLAGLRVPLLLFGLCLAAQLYLVFFKSLNWDEFLHFSMVYQLKAGTLVQSFQVFHLRLLSWAPDSANNLLDQMRAARIFIWGMHVLTLFMIYGVARQFTNVGNAFFASFAYLTAGYAFTQGFSIRADPLVTATLMSALFLLASGRLSIGKAVGIGALIGLAGMMTFKAMFFAPCFAGLAWLQYRQAADKHRLLAGLAVLAVVALASFAAIYQLHTWNIPERTERLRNPSSVAFYLRWFTPDLPFAAYIGREIILAPLFFLSLIFAPQAWKKAGLERDSKLAIAGFIAPLAVLLFYRNTFPYFFVFILAPVAVAIAPALGLLRDRYGNAFLAIALSVIPLALAVLEPREVIVRQKALIDYVHREFPHKTGYLDYSGMIADYPRIFDYLTSGNGIRLYHESGEPIVGREIDRGNLPFIIANQHAIVAALQGRPEPGSFLPADLSAMTGNYVQQWGVLWREGRQIPAGTKSFEFLLRRSGDFVLAGGPLGIDGATVTNGGRIHLDKGRHVVRGGRIHASTLWRGDRLPAPPPKLPMNSVFTNF
jgi:hypothetical protein